jgi:hypothetical protein
MISIKIQKNGDCEIRTDCDDSFELYNDVANAYMGIYNILERTLSNAGIPNPKKEAINSFEYIFKKTTKVIKNNETDVKWGDFNGNV